MGVDAPLRTGSRQRNPPTNLQVRHHSSQHSSLPTLQNVPVRTQHNPHTCLRQRHQKPQRQCLGRRFSVLSDRMAVSRSTNSAWMNVKQRPTKCYSGCGNSQGSGRQNRGAATSSRVGMCSTTGTTLELQTKTQDRYASKRITPRVNNLLFSHQSNRHNSPRSSHPPCPLQNPHLSRRRQRLTRPHRPPRIPPEPRA